MRNTVILDPIEFLVTPASRIICDHAMHENEFLREARNKEARLFSKLREGILDTRLLDILWKDRPDHIKILQDLLVRLARLLDQLPGISNFESVILATGSSLVVHQIGSALDGI